MKQEIDPKTTSRAEAFELWIKSPMPMVTLTKTLDVTHAVRVSRRKGVKFNMLMCWCVGRAAMQQAEFLLLPEGGKLYRYDRLAVNVIVPNSKGGISSCDIPIADSLSKFADDYERLTHKVAESGESSFLEDHMIVGTSTLVQTEIDCIVNQYTDLFCNPMVMWARYRKRWFKTTLPISFQFHHAQMDGMQAATFLKLMQDEIQRVWK